jgi:hypothetical protein
VTRPKVRPRNLSCVKREFLLFDFDFLPHQLKLVIRFIKNLLTYMLWSVFRYTYSIRFETARTFDFQQSALRELDRSALVLELE